MKKIAAFLFCLTLILGGRAQDYVVTTTADGGAGSLRYALQMCMTAAGPHTIRFNLPTTDAGYDATTGTWVIRPASVLPMVMQSGVTLDGTSQTAFGGDTNPLGPEVAIDGGGTLDYGLRILNAGDAVLRGLNIRNCTKGVQVYNSPNCRVAGCYIGVDATATSAAANDIGLEFIAGSDNAVIGGSTPADRNIISGNEHIGIRLLDVTGCTVSGCYIGLDRTGTAAIPNYDGMSMEGAVTNCTIGGTTEGERNLISGNTDYGLPLFGVGATNNVIIGNYIGTDVTGTVAIGNTYGVLFDDGSFGNRVGGDTEAERNVISGNVGYGVFFYNNGTNSNILKNNYIGTDHTGMTAVPNTAGIIIDGISYQNTMDGNLISGNLQVGIGINITGSDGNVVVRNRIGVNAVGAPLPNGMDGIRISQGPENTLIGGLPEEANIIAHNGGCGVYITNDNCRRHRISCNNFYENGGLAIDLFEPGVNANDAGDGDDGANGKLNYPVLTSVMWTGGRLHVVGTLDTENPAACEVQLYRAAVDPWGHGEGRDYLTSVTPSADGTFSAELNAAENDYITALTIDGQGNTSEFSNARSTGGPAAVSEISEVRVELRPNPARETVQIITTVPYTEVRLCDVTGRLVSTQTVGTGAADISALAPGIYLLQLWDHGTMVGSAKVVKE